MHPRLLITIILLLAIIPLIFYTPNVDSADYGKETSTTKTTTTNQAATATSTSVPENIDLIVPMIFAAGALLVYGKFKRANSTKDHP